MPIDVLHFLANNYLNLSQRDPLCLSSEPSDRRPAMLGQYNNDSITRLVHHARAAKTKFEHESHNNNQNCESIQDSADERSKKRHKCC